MRKQDIDRRQIVQWPVFSIMLQQRTQNQNGYPGLEQQFEKRNPLVPGKDNMASITHTISSIISIGYSRPCQVLEQSWGNLEGGLVFSRVALQHLCSNLQALIQHSNPKTFDFPVA